VVTYVFVSHGSLLVLGFGLFVCFFLRDIYLVRFVCVCVCVCVSSPNILMGNEVQEDGSVQIVAKVADFGLSR